MNDYVWAIYVLMNFKCLQFCLHLQTKITGCNDNYISVNVLIVPLGTFFFVNYNLLIWLSFLIKLFSIRYYRIALNNYSFILCSLLFYIEKHFCFCYRIQYEVSQFEVIWLRRKGVFSYRRNVTFPLVNVTNVTDFEYDI